MSDSKVTIDNGNVWLITVKLEERIVNVLNTKR